MYPSPCKLCSVRGRGLPQTNQYNWTHNSKQILIENTRNTHTYIHSELILNGYHMFAGECLMIQHNLIVLCNVIYALAMPLTHCLVVFYLATKIPCAFEYGECISALYSHKCSHLSRESNPHTSRELYVESVSQRHKSHLCNCLQYDMSLIAVKSKSHFPAFSTRSTALTF